MKYNKCLGEEEIIKFEKKWSIVLPEQYRCFLKNVGNGTKENFMDYGISSLQEWCQPYEEADLPENILREEFRADNVDNDKLSTGSIRICNAGCENYIILVVSGNCSGEIWTDYRIDGEGIKPINTKGGTPMTFANWLQNVIEHRENHILETSGNRKKMNNF